MKYVVQITPDDSVTIAKYQDYQTINDLVDGWYEVCAYLSKHHKNDSLLYFFTDYFKKKTYHVYCNEEYLLHDKCKFNALATIICNQAPIYGNVVITLEGYNEEGEKDSIPFELQEAQKVQTILSEFAQDIMPVLDILHKQYDDNKPQIYVQFGENDTE